jgi:uncharacterized membrane protein
LTALALALGASLAWGVADFVGPLLSRGLGTLRVLLWAQIGGVAAIGIAVAIRGEGPAGWGVLFAIAASFGGMLGLFAYYRGMVVGAMSVVAPIAGVSAVIPVAFGIATGDQPSTVQLAGVGCALAGVGLASVEHHEGTRRIAAGAGLALLAAIGFGFYFPWMHAAGKIDFWWASLVFRLTALMIVAAAVAARRPALKLRPRARDRRSGRCRRHPRQRALRGGLRTRSRQPDVGARLALPGRDGAPRRRRPARARRADAASRHPAHPRRRWPDLGLTGV